MFEVFKKNVDISEGKNRRWFIIGATAFVFVFAGLMVVFFYQLGTCLP